MTPTVTLHLGHPSPPRPASGTLLLLGPSPAAIPCGGGKCKGEGRYLVRDAAGVEAARCRSCLSLFRRLLSYRLVTLLM